MKEWVDVQSRSHTLHCICILPEYETNDLFSFVQFDEDQFAWFDRHSLSAQLILKNDDIPADLPHKPTPFVITVLLIQLIYNILLQSERILEIENYWGGVNICTFNSDKASVCTMMCSDWSSLATGKRVEDRKWWQKTSAEGFSQLMLLSFRLSSNLRQQRILFIRVKRRQCSLLDGREIGLPLNRWDGDVVVL